MRTRTGRGLLCAALLALAAGPTLAHNVPFSYLDLGLSQGGLEGRLEVHSGDLAGRLGAVEGLLGDPLLGRQYMPAVSRFVAEGLSLEADGRPLTPEGLTLRPLPAKNAFELGFSARWDRSPRRLRVRCRLFPESAAHVTYLTLRQEGGAPRLPVPLTAKESSFTLDTHLYRSRADAGLAFVRQGIHHIFIGPDHIAFILGLILLGGSVLRLAQIVTGFTVAHSITLALAALGILRPPARLIEPLIALSIVYIGVENLRAAPGRADRRALIAFVFGFVHGFGFASVLAEFGLPRAVLGVALFSFNVGVELGQLCIVLCALPVLARLRDLPVSLPRAAGRPPGALTAGHVLSGLVVCSGTFWLAQRLLSPG